jgi:hypothetical protein
LQLSYWVGKTHAPLAHVIDSQEKPDDAVSQAAPMAPRRTHVPTVPVPEQV